jgi:HlyD family secretion protein
VNVGTQVSGIVQHLYADFNDHVKQGQLLARLDTTALRTQLDQSLASLKQAQAQYSFQEAAFTRFKVLYEKEIISKSDYELALFNFENAQASLSNAQSALARTQVNLAYATIYSPIDGVVLNRAVEEGQTVAASFNTPVLFTIVQDLTKMEVQTSVDEADIGKIKIGQRVEFTVDAYPDDKFKASVSEVRLQPVTTNNVVTYVVILNAPNPDKKLMPGMTANATIFTEEKENVLTIPGKALRFRPDTSYVNKMTARRNADLANAGGKAVEKPAQHKTGVIPQVTQVKKAMVWIRDGQYGLRPNMVETGINNGTTVEILTGLKEGDEVVISMSKGNSAAGLVKETRPAQNMGPGYGG